MQIVRGLDQKLPEQSRRKSPIRGEWLLVEAGQAPENFSGTLRRFQPDLVILIDAADMGQSAGSVACLDWREAGGWSASTHNLPMNMLSAFLVSELDCQVMVLGIQPAQIGMGQPLSRQVELAEEEIIAELHSLTSKGK